MNDRVLNVIIFASAVLSASMVVIFYISPNIQVTIAQTCDPTSVTCPSPTSTIKFPGGVIVTYTGTTAPIHYTCDSQTKKCTSIKNDAYDAVKLAADAGKVCAGKPPTLACTRESCSCDWKQ